MEESYVFLLLKEFSIVSLLFDQNLETFVNTANCIEICDGDDDDDD